MDSKQLKTLIDYAQNFRGVSIRGKSIWLSFNYRGERCREPMKGTTLTKSNIKHASLRHSAILHEISTDSFDYEKHFPTSKRAKRFAVRKPKRKTVAEAMITWLEIKQVETAPSTFVNYRRKVDKHILPYWGDQYLDEIPKSEIEYWMKVKLARLSNKTINDVLIPLRGILKDACDDGLIEKDPMARINNLRVIKKAPDPFTREEITRVMETNTSQQSELNAFEFCCWTGLSVSEMMALAWEDIDLEQKSMKVRRARVEGEYKITKEVSRDRIVELLPPAMTVLKRQQLISFMLPTKRHKVRQRDNKTFQTEAIRVVFTRTPQNARNAVPQGFNSDLQYRERFFQDILRKAKVRYRAPNQARHTFASQLLTAGVPKEWIAMQMGHTSTKMIDEHYGKWIVEERPDMRTFVSDLMGLDENDGHNMGKNSAKEIKNTLESNR